MKTFTPKEVYTICEKEIEELRKNGTPEPQLTIIQLGYLNLYGALVLWEIENKDAETSV